MLVVLGQLQVITLVMTNRNSGIMHGIKKIHVAKLIQSVRKNLIPGVYMICMATFMSGFRIGGIITIKALLLTVVLGKMGKALAAFSGAEAGMPQLEVAGRPLAMGTNNT